MMTSNQDNVVTPKIRFDRVTKTYATDSGEPVIALSETSFDIAEGEFVCVVGPSGCGKSTLMQMLAGFHAPSSGQTLVDGVQVRRPDADRGWSSSRRTSIRG